MLCVMALEEQGLRPERGEVVVTGAAGGVGSIAIPLLKRAGFTVVASSGRPELADYLTGLGADRVVDRRQFSEGSKAPLDSATWAGAVDSVGGATLVHLLKAMQYHGVVAACGLAGGAAFNGTVYPFILRGVRLIGIESAYIASEQRHEVWERLARDLDQGLLAGMTRHIPLSAVPGVAPDFLGGKVQGRLVVDTAD
jgi:acrylyl-CoA reductase (NADPH)